MPRDVSLSDSKCWNGGHEWVNLKSIKMYFPEIGRNYDYSRILNLIQFDLVQLIPFNWFSIHIFLSELIPFNLEKKNWTDMSCISRNWFCAPFIVRKTTIFFRHCWIDLNSGARLIIILLNPLMPVGNYSYQFFICCPRDAVSRTANVERTVRH